MLYIDEVLPEIQAENPDANGIQARKIAIQMFRALNAEEKQVCFFVDQTKLFSKFN